MKKFLNGLLRYVFIQIISLIIIIIIMTALVLLNVIIDYYHFENIFLTLSFISIFISSLIAYYDTKNITNFF